MASSAEKDGANVRWRELVIINFVERQVRLQSITSDFSETRTLMTQFLFLIYSFSVSQAIKYKFWVILALV